MPLSEQYITSRIQARTEALGRENNGLFDAVLASVEVVLLLSNDQPDAVKQAAEAFNKRVLDFFTEQYDRFL